MENGLFCLPLHCKEGINAKTNYQLSLIKYALLLLIQKHPPFWNDVPLYRLLQQTNVCQSKTQFCSCLTMSTIWTQLVLFMHCGQIPSKRPTLTQFSEFPCNVLLWAILQLKLHSKGISSPLATVMPGKQALDYLRKGILVLNQHYGARKY